MLLVSASLRKTKYFNKNSISNIHETGNQIQPLLPSQQIIHSLYTESYEYYNAWSLYSVHAYIYTENVACFPEAVVGQ